MAASYILIIVMEALVVLGVVRYVKKEFGLKISNSTLHVNEFSPCPAMASRS